jgi:hypothetical protein
MSNLSRTNLLLVSVALVATLTTTVAVTSTSAAGSGVSQRIELADNSLDTTPAARTEAVRVLGLIADLAASEQGVVAAAPFQASALATIDWPINHRFIASPSDPNSYYRKLDLAQQADTVKKQAKTLFVHQSGRQGTDIIGGLLAASEQFASQPSGSRVLVLVSNMWAYSPSDRLILKRQPLDSGQIARLINRLDRDGKIARLHQVCVYVVGAGLDPYRRIPTAVQLSMRAFWHAYLGKAGATVRGWTPTLDSEPSC